MRLRAACAVLTSWVLLGAGSQSLDSQYVLQRYASALESALAPKVVVYAYTVSQVGASNIEERHRIYRSGNDVRDETLSVDGIALTHKVVQFSHHPERYTIERFAPRSDSYELLFVGTARDGRHLDYVYEATPLDHTAGAAIDRVTIDGANFLPRVVHFHSGGLDITGSGEIEFGSFGRYWMPVSASAQAVVKGKPARERIVWGEYAFPASLPTSTFEPPKPLPESTISPP